MDTAAAALTRGIKKMMSCSAVNYYLGQNLPQIRAKSGPATLQVTQRSAQVFQKFAQFTDLAEFGISSSFFQ